MPSATPPRSVDFRTLTPEQRASLNDAQRTDLLALKVLTRAADRATGLVLASCRWMGSTLHRHHGTVSRAFKRLESAKLIDFAGVDRDTGAHRWIVALPRSPLVSVARAQRPTGAARQFQTRRALLAGLVAARIRNGVLSDPGKESAARARTARLIAGGTPPENAANQALREIHAPGWEGSLRELLKRGVSFAVAELLALAFPSARVDSVCWYADKRGYGPGALHDALIHRWSTD